MSSNFDDPSSQSASDIAQTVSFFLCKCLLLAFITHVSVGETHENKFILLYTDVQNDSSCCVKPYARRCGVSWRKRPTKRQQPTLQCHATVPTSQAIPDQLFVKFTQTAVTNTCTCTRNTHMHAHTHTQGAAANLTKVLAFTGNTGIPEDQAHHLQQVIPRQAALVCTLNAQPEVVVQSYIQQQHIP